MNGNHYDRHKLIEARVLLGKSPQDIARQLHVSRQTIYRAEAGTAISYELLADLCGFYRIPLTNIVHDFPQAVAA